MSARRPRALRDAEIAADAAYRARVAASVARRENPTPETRAAERDAIRAEVATRAALRRLLPPARVDVAEFLRRLGGVL